MLIHEYKESWIADFNQIKQIIDEALRDLNVSIEHVGSTSIPALAAKPIIDIDIVFAKNVEFDKIRLGLEKIGYHHAGNQGIEGREVFKRSKTAPTHRSLDLIAHHLYVCPIDSQELQKHILFRDYLTANKDARVEYQNMKYEIADEAKQDRKKYAQLKEVRAANFINGIIEKAKIGKKH